MSSGSCVFLLYVRINSRFNMISQDQIQLFGNAHPLLPWQTVGVLGVI